MIDIEVLRVAWWVLVGVLFIGFAIMDGWDLGAAILLPLVARNEEERRIVLTTIGPVWEGNQVWIITAAGALFAAWPFVYATAFSVVYFPVLLLLLTMGISRPVSFKYRSKLRNMLWRRTWDWVVFCGGFFPAIIFGVLVGNILSGIPFYLDNELRIFNAGSVWDLFNPFALWCGVVSLAMLVMHGGMYLAVKTENGVRKRAIYWGRVGAVILMITFALAGVWIAFFLPGYQVTSDISHTGYSNPLHKEVISQVGAWLINYKTYPFTLLAPTLGFAGALFAILTAEWDESKLAFICSSISEIGVIGTVGVSMFPFILPSSTNFTSSLLVWDASSSYLTLLVMLIAALIFLPIILMYTAWVHRVMRGKVTRAMVKNEKM